MTAQPDPPHVVLGRAHEKLEAGALGEAEDLVRGVLRTLPNFPPALHLLGLVLHAAGRVDEGIASLEESLVFAPRDVDVRMNLGIFLMESAPARAKEHFTFALELDPKLVPAYGNLASICFDRGELEEAERHLRALLDVSPRDQGGLGLLARVLRRRGKHAEEVATAKALLALDPENRELHDAIARSYFLWFDSVDRDPATAKAVLREWLDFTPRDPVALHMNAAHGGAAAPARASNEYVEYHFDHFAASFDDVLAKLEYRGPAATRAALERTFPTPTASLVVADLGCGTGALGPLVKPWAKRLVGVDLSQRMLDRASVGGHYDELVREEITAFLSSRAAAFDLLLAADTLVYLGDLDAVFKAVATSLRAGGVFITTMEELAEDDTKIGYRLHSAGRYAHKRSYVSRRIAAASMNERELVSIELRKELGVAVRSYLAVIENQNPEFA